MSLLPCSRVPTGWHACTRCSIAPVTVFFKHIVFHILAHTPEKFNDNRIQDKRDIIFLVLTIPPALQPTMQSVGTCVPKNPLLHLTNPFTHMCIMNLHMFPQVSVAIGATMAEILMPQYLSSLLSRKQLCHLLCILVSWITNGRNIMLFCSNILCIYSPTTPQNISSFRLCYNHANTYHNHRCPPAFMLWMHRCFSAFLAKPLCEPPKPLSNISVISFHMTLNTLVVNYVMMAEILIP